MFLPTTRRLTFDIAPAADPAFHAPLTHLVDGAVADPEAGRNLFRVDPDLGARPGARIVLVRVGGEPIGGVATWIDPEGTHAWLGSLVVRRDWRGLGLATRLVRIAVEDREACDGQALPILATVRITPEGRLNRASFRALAAAGFTAGATLRVPVAGFGPRGAHLAASAEPDGCIRQLVALRVVVPAAFAELC